MQVTNIKMKKSDRVPKKKKKKKKKKIFLKKQKKKKKKKKKKKAAEHYFHKIRSTFYMEITWHKLIFKTKDRVKT